MKMNRLMHLFTTIVLLILGAIVLVWPLVTGLSLERNFGSTLEMLSDPQRWSLHDTKFNRGWFTSEARSNLTLKEELAQYLDPKVPRHLILIHHIQHGPVLGIGRPSLLPAAALIETTVEFPLDTQEWLQPLFHQDPPLRLRTLVKLDGEIISRIESPAVQGELTGGAQIQWQGMGGTLEISNLLNMVRGEITLPLLELTNNSGKLRIELVKIKLDYHHHQLGLWLGDINLDLKNLAFVVPGQLSQQLSLSGFGVSGISREEAQTLRAIISMDLADLSIGGQPFTSGGLTVDLRGIELSSFATVYNKLKDLDIQLDTNRSLAKEEITKTIVAHLPNLMHYSPEVSISRLDFKTPHGTVQGKFRIALTGSKDARNITPLEIFQYLVVEAELNAPAPLVMDLLQAQTAKEIAEQYLSALVSQNLLVKSNNSYRTHVKFAKQQLNINGRTRNELLGILSMMDKK